MRVAYVTMAFPAPSETFACNDVRSLSSAGIDVSVHSLRPAFPHWRTVAADRGVDGVPISHNSFVNSLSGTVHALRQPRLLLKALRWTVASTGSRPFHLFRSLLLLPRAFDILRRVERARPQIVHLFWGHYPALVGFLVRQTKPDIVLSVFLGAYDLSWGYGGTEPIARTADVVWTHADHNIPAIERLGVSRSRVRRVYRGIDLTSWDREGAKVPCRIVTAGRLLPNKGMDTVLLAFQKVRQLWPAATLVVVGDGVERRNLKALAASLGIDGAVRFTGSVPHKDVLAEMSSAEVFLFLSRKNSERLPNVVKEAIASRCVCVVSETPGITELVADGVSGLLVPRSDASAAAERLDRIFKNPQLAQSLKALAEKNLRENFDLDRSMETYVEVWGGLVSDQRKTEALEARHLAGHQFDRTSSVSAGSTGSLGRGNREADLETDGR
jgi:colanic acid/amylovoran biosynthesis glycosyltransferase